jgi:hypothetical protein
MQRPRPVLILGMVVAALTAVTTYADVENVIPNPALNWIRLGTVILGAVGAVYVQSVVTPLSSPQTKDGRPLIPARSPDRELP